MENVIPTEPAVMETTDPAKAPLGNAGIIPNEDPHLSTEGDMVRPSNESAVGQLADQANAVPETQTSVKQDADRFEYWQSKNDRTQSELNNIQQQFNAYRQQMDPLAATLQQNPEVLQNLQQSLSNEQPAQQNSLQTPVRPDKPHSYNEVDAYNDPESDSFKYRLTNDKYRDDMIDHYGKVDEHRQVQQMRTQEVQKEKMAEGQAYNHAVTSLGWTPQKTTQAIKWLQNPGNVTFDALFKVYDMMNAPNKQAVQTQQRVAEYQNREERMRVPQSTAVASGTPQAPKNDEQLFNEGMLSWKK
mgnify:CR=1 FL=1